MLLIPDAAHGHAISIVFSALNNYWMVETKNTAK